MQVVKGMYRHFKGGDTLFEVLGEATHSETGEKLVVYRHIEQGVPASTFWVRPVTMFYSEVPKDRENPSGQRYRFERIEE